MTTLSRSRRVAAFGRALISCGLGGHLWPMKAILAVLAVGVLGAGCGSNSAHAPGGGTGGTESTAGASGGAGVSGGAGTSAGAGAGATGKAGADAAPDTTSDAGAGVAPDGAGQALGDAPVDTAEAGTSAAGTIVPLYTDPSDTSWAAIVEAKKAHPRVRVVAIANPNSGPGAARDAAYTTGIAKLEAAGIEVIGYVATGYAAHSVASMEAEIDTWRSFYPSIGGIFFDEQSDKTSDLDYYRTLSQYAKTHGAPYTVGNPGTDTAESYIGALDTMLIYESKGLPSVSTLGGWHAKYAPSNFGVIPYGASFDAGFVKAAREDVGFVYIQNDDLPNPWDTLPPFFGDLLAALE
jgi:hypothetical protein